jgi:polysaccharide biosynthesis/export protein
VGLCLFALTETSNFMCIHIEKWLCRHLLPLISCLILTLSACAGSNYSSPAENPASPATLSAAGASSASQLLNTADENDSSAVLETLWRERTAPSAAGANSGFSLGPGDILRISVPMIRELTDRKVRVSEDDTIALPLLGTINVAGMTEQDLRQELASRAGRYMYNPQVEVYLQTPENRVVSVLGEVKAPGRYLVASRADTIMTLLSRAGGATDKAGSQILFFPAPAAPSGAAAAPSLHRPGVVKVSTGTALDQLERHGATASAHQMSDSDSLPVESAIAAQQSPGSPLMISLAGPEQYLDMPVHPGDVLFVPAAGSVYVQGWVDKAGLFPITPGMTVLGSIAAAGGALYTSSATLIRTEQGGQQRKIALNLSKIKSGQEPNLPVRGGDVIIVNRSVVGALPYTLYFILNRSGLGLPLFY